MNNDFVSRPTVYLSIGRLFLLIYILYLGFAGDPGIIAAFKEDSRIGLLLALLSVIYLSLFVFHSPGKIIKTTTFLLILLFCELFVGAAAYAILPVTGIVAVFLFPILDLAYTKGIFAGLAWGLASLFSYFSHFLPFSKQPVMEGRSLQEFVLFFGALGMLAFLVSGFRAERLQLSMLLSLLESTHEIGAKLNIDSVLKSLLQVVRTFFSCHTALVYLINPTSENKLVELRGVNSEHKMQLPDFSLNDSSSFLAEVMRERKTQLIRSLRTLSDPVISPARYFCGSMAVPILHEEEPLGVILIVHNQEGYFSSYDLKTLEIMANQAALAIRNAQLHEAATSLSITDSLTQLYTHGYLQEQLILKAQEYRQNNKPFSVAMFDVDFFKRINDSLGHPKGDRVLYSIASIMKDYIPYNAGMVARYGGDEFAVALWGMKRTEAAAFADKIRSAVHERAFIVTRPELTRITISAGVAEFPIDANDVSELIDAADCALYDAKRKGRNKVSLFTPTAFILPEDETTLEAPQLTLEKQEKVVSLQISGVTKEHVDASTKRIQEEDVSGLIAKLLTNREQEILKQVATGKSNKEIAEEFSISESTVKTHLTNIQNKLALNDRKELLMFVVKHRIM